MRRSRPWPEAALAALTVAAALAPSSAGDIPLLLAFAALAGAVVVRGSGWLTIPAFVAFEATVGVRTDAVVPLAIIFAGAWWIGREVRVRRELIVALADRATAIEAEEAAFRALSVQRERARIARELHDIVSHHLAMIVVQAGAGRIAAGAPDASRFAAIGAGGREALAELSRLVDLLGADGDADRVRALLDRVAASGVDLRLIGSSLPEGGAELAYHVLQEGLTNAVKHAPGSAVEVRIDRASVSVRDWGGGSANGLARTGSGLGLAGVRARVEAAGGTLEAGPAPGGGWRLHARTPTG